MRNLSAVKVNGSSRDAESIFVEQSSPVCFDCTSLPVKKSLRMLIHLHLNLLGSEEVA